jgi:hypothetical protein
VAAVLSKCYKHFKTAVIIEVAFVLEEKPKITIFNSKAKLPFPHSACSQIEGISDQSIIRAACREVRDAEVMLYQLKIVDEGFCILQFAQCEGLRGTSHLSHWRRSRNWRSTNLSKNMGSAATLPHDRGQLGSHRRNKPGPRRRVGQMWWNSLASNWK